MPAYAVAFLDRFLGAEPNWLLPDDPRSRPAMVGGSRISDRAPADPSLTGQRSSSIVMHNQNLGHFLVAGKLVIFDCDGVLVDSEPLAAEAYERVYEKHGMSGVGASIIAQCIGMKQADILVKIRELTGHQFPDHAHDDIWAETKQLFTEKLAETEGLRHFLDALPAARCVASSSSLERIHHSLEITGLAPYFGDAIYSSSMVKRGKPAPDIFLHAAEKMGADPAAMRGDRGFAARRRRRGRGKHDRDRLHRRRPHL